MPDERPDETPKFGRRPRHASAPHGAEPPQAPKPKVRIGPRRPDAQQPQEVQKTSLGGVRKPAPGKPQQGQNSSKRAGGGPERTQGGGGKRGRKTRRKDRFQGRGQQQLPLPGLTPASEGTSAPAADDSELDSANDAQQGGASVPGQGLSRNARRRKRRKERREERREAPPSESESDIFEPARPLELTESDDVSFEEDESDLNVVEMPPPTGERRESLELEGDDEDSDDEEVEAEAGEDTAVDLPVAESGAPAPQRESRSKRRRKKRRERLEAAIVDRSSGFWWADQWIRSFEVLYVGGASRARLQKGRSYARRGQVTELEVGPNGVIARVQGSRPKPYQVRLELNRLRRETWGRILHQIAGKAAFLAQLLEGTLPPEIEDVFFAAGARLFPHGDNDVRSRCTCPDPVVPCKHVAAVHYALADALQRDPFLLFALRGKSRDQFIQDLRDMRGRDGARREPAPVAVEDMGRFWRMGRLAESVLRPTGWGSGGDPARLVQSLGEPQLEGIREGLFLPMLESTYRQVSEGMRRLPKDS